MLHLFIKKSHRDLFKIHSLFGGCKHFVEVVVRTLQLLCCILHIGYFVTTFIMACIAFPQSLRLFKRTQEKLLQFTRCDKIVFCFVKSRQHLRIVAVEDGIELGNGHECTEIEIVDAVFHRLRVDCSHHTKRYNAKCDENEQ